MIYHVLIYYLGLIKEIIMKVELTRQQVDGLILSVDAALSQLGFSKMRHENYSHDIEKDIEFVKKIRDKVILINRETLTPMTKYETYMLISIASNYEELHEQPQDTMVNNIVKVKLNILDIIKTPLPYIDIIFIRLEKDETEIK